MQQNEIHRQTYRVLGVNVDALNLEQLHALVNNAVQEKLHCIIANHNLHSIFLFHRDQKMRSFYDQATAIHIDGMPIIFCGQLLGHPLRREHRLTSLDWLRQLIANYAVPKGWRIFYLGSMPGVIEKGREILRREFPELEIATNHGYFDVGSPENDQIVACINAFRPQILIVGMGMPRQEHWILDNFDRLNANVIFPLGAFMDFVAGAIPTPPRWMGRVGLEWLYRLVSEPKRLGRRYLVEPWFMAGLLLKEISQHIVVKRQGK